MHSYCTGHIRKVTRRARGAQWEATADLPGLTLTDGDTQVRVLVPGLVSDLDKRIARLQVGDTDVPVDAADGTPLHAPSLLVHVPAGQPLTAGKLMAQTGHAGMIAAALSAIDHAPTLQAWRDAGCPARVRRASEQAWAHLTSLVADPARAWREHRFVAVRDAGFTEVAAGTVTAVARFAA